MRQMNPVHAIPLYFLKIHFNHILPSITRSYTYSLPSGFPTRTLYTCLFSHMCATCLAHLILLDCITPIVFGQVYDHEDHHCAQNPAYLQPKSVLLTIYNVRILHKIEQNTEGWAPQWPVHFDCYWSFVRPFISFIQQSHTSNKVQYLAETDKIPPYMYLWAIFIAAG